jgi:hypothetical protein
MKRSQEKFFEGLNDELSVQLISGDYEDFQKLVDKAIHLEDKHWKMESKKRKMANARMFQGQSQKPRYAFPPQVGSSSAAQRAPRPQMNNKLQNSGWNNGQHPTPARVGPHAEIAPGRYLCATTTMSLDTSPTSAQSQSVRKLLHLHAMPTRTTMATATTTTTW